MPARKNLKHQDIVRERIRTSMLVRRLQQFALGQKGDQGETIDLSTNEIRAIEILLKKKLPDLSAVEHTGEITYRDASELTDAELAHIAAAGSAGAVEATSGKTNDPSVH